MRNTGILRSHESVSSGGRIQEKEIGSYYSGRKVVEGKEKTRMTYRVIKSEGKYTENSSDMMIGGGISPRFCTVSQIALEILSRSSVRYSWNAHPLHSNKRHWRSFTRCRIRVMVRTLIGARRFRLRSPGLIVSIDLNEQTFFGHQGG